jgi:hypothetical protein
MGKVIKVNAGTNGVYLSDGKFHGQGEVITVTDAQYAALPASVISSISTMASGVAEPTGAFLDMHVATLIPYLQPISSLAAKTTSYNYALTDYVVIANGASVTLSLPDPTAVIKGLRYTAKNINAASATVNSQGSSKTLDGAASQSLAQWAKASYISDGAQWLTV